MAATKYEVRILSFVWPQKGLIHVEFMPRGETINSDASCETLLQLWRAIQNKRRGLLSTKACLIRWQRAASCISTNTWTGKLLSLQPWLGSKWLTFFQNRRILWMENNFSMTKCWNKQWQLGWECAWQKSTTYNIGVEKLGPRYNKCNNNHGDFK